MLMRISALSFFLLLSYYGLKAQQVNGLAQDDQGKPLANASIVLKKAKDSSVVKLSISTATGVFEFSSVDRGSYFITISHIGYTSKNSPTFQTLPGENTNVPAIVLTRFPKQLSQAVVMGQKPLVEVKNDRIILNVEGSINEVGSDALELLRKSPGVEVDNLNNLSLDGKNGVQVYVDGRPTYLSGTALADYLKTLQSSSVESIEIISHPSAKYEAAGNAGIINIRLKKNRSYGTNMNISAGYNIGTYSKYNGAISFNHREKKLNVYGDASFNHSQNATYSNQYRSVLDSFFLQRSTYVETNNTLNYKAGLDWSPDKNSTLGIVVNGSSEGSVVRTASNTPIVYIPTNQTNRILQANNHTVGSRDNVNTDLNYHYTDSAGRELNIDGDYGLYRIRSNQFQPNNYFDSTGKILLYSNDYNIISPTNIDIYSLKLDYGQNLFKGRLGFGAKSSYVTTTNDFGEYDLFSAGPVMDTLNSNNFDYKENINALYVLYDRTIKSWSFEGGLRAENTNLKGTSTGYRSAGDQYNVYDSSFTRHYTDLFPSASITYDRNAAGAWSLNCSRRIDRPDYQALNPFQFKIDDYTFSQGNTLLHPQYTNSIGLTYRHSNWPFATLSYSHVNGLFTTLADTTDGSKTIVRNENLASQDIVGLNLGYPFKYKWYNTYISVNSFYQLNKANFGPGRVVDVNVFHTTVYSQHSFQLGGGWMAQLTQVYISPRILQATLLSRSMWSLDGGLQKTIFNGNGTFKVSVTDIFNTLHWSATSNFAGQYIKTTGGYESRLLKLYFTYSLGNHQLKAARRHSNAAEDENNRVGR